MKRIKVIKLLQCHPGINIDMAERELNNAVVIDSRGIVARDDIKLKDLSIHKLDDNSFLFMCSMFAAVCTIEDITTMKLIKLNGRVIGAFESHLSTAEVLHGIEIEEFK